MGLRINTNVQSLQAQNNLKKTTNSVNQSLTRLSTGLRINTGKDDVVGLAKSETLRSKIRGNDVALNNISNANSFLGVGEGYLAQLTDIAQQMRESAVQAADGTISAADRTSLRDKFSSLMNEFNRLANGANYTGVKILDGTFTNKTLQVGSDAGETISISIGDARSTTIGKVAVYTVSTKTDASTVSGASATFTDIGSFSLTVNGISTSISTADLTADGVSTVESDESALAYVNAINSKSGTTGVTANILSNVVTIDYSSGNALESTMHLLINGVTVRDSSITSTISAADDTDMATVVSNINAVASQTGVTATQDTTTHKITLTATDGRNINMQISAPGTAVTAYNAFGITGSSQNTQNTYRGSFTMQADSAFSIADSSSAVSGAQSVSLDSNSVLSKADLNSVANATTAITTLSNVVSQLQSRRASIGSTGNRLDIATAELQSRQENLSAAQSLIRDADIAAETAKLTQAKILQQAGATVLAQANASPQIALSLLQNL